MLNSIVFDTRKLVARLRQLWSGTKRSEIANKKKHWKVIGLSIIPLQEKIAKVEKTNKIKIR
jgi:hypothetical protein